MNISRRDFMKIIGLSASSVFCSGGCAEVRRLYGKQVPKRPNIVFFLADDLGYGELGCYGQKKIKTPHIDQLAREGMKFLQYYSGNPVCAPSRCTLMTGLHTGHAQIRSNRQVGGKEGWKLGSTIGGQWPLEEGTVTVAKILQQAGYTTGAFGKWGLGRAGTSGDPNKQGFDYFFGYICQRQAHTYYPNHLWRNGEVVRIPENEDGQEKVYSHDLIAGEARQFLKNNKDKLFFLYVPFTIPHVALQVPEDSLVEYKGKWADPPYDGKKGYVPHSQSRACYAAMVSRMDKDVGRIVSLLKELGLEENTLVIFTSDNGPTYAGGADSEFFESAGPLRGLKGSVYEGGIRVPFIARWPGKIQAGVTSNYVSAFWDFLPTCAELVGVPAPEQIDGISILPTLLGHPEKQPLHEDLYWELNGSQAVRRGNWKVVRTKPNKKAELYNLANDVGEQHDVGGEHPEILAQMTKLLQSARTKSEVFPLVKNKAGRVKK